MVVWVHFSTSKIVAWSNPWPGSVFEVKGLNMPINFKGAVIT